MLSDVNSIGWERGMKGQIGRKGFEVFWYEFRKKQIDAGREDFEGLCSPYEI